MMEELKQLYTQTRNGSADVVGVPRPASGSAIMYYQIINADDELIARIACNDTFNTLMELEALRRKYKALHPGAKYIVIESISAPGSGDYHSSSH
jgi:predicted methyltransferase